MTAAHNLVSPNHRTIRKYYESLRALHEQRVLNEMNLRSPFESLLADAARLRGWTLIPELSDKSSGGSIRPDGTLRDGNSLPRGYWEAKDTKDDLDAEIRRKTARGYKLSNTKSSRSGQSIHPSRGYAQSAGDLKALTKGYAQRPVAAN
ncbi:MAG: hypothetical protein HYX72_12090 [Acidobacteria bacterium]|nr:hypothetical protein [Acidobacteriota bacterium]